MAAERSDRSAAGAGAEVLACGRNGTASVRRLGGTLRGLMFSPDSQMLVGASGFFSEPGALRFYRAPLLSKIDISAGKAIQKK